MSKRVKNTYGRPTAKTIGNTLASGYSWGWFGEPDYATHLFILWNLVKQGSPGAMNNIGFAYQHGLGLHKSLRWAVYWYEKAARMGNIDAMGNLMALMGADLGDEMAMNELGLCYEYGYGVPLCEEKAFEWIKKAVENGAGACAEHNLARFYRKGIGTKIDEAKAEEWERIAAEHGYKKDPKTKNYDSR